MASDDTYGDNVLAGPPVGYWTCPCCGETVQRLLPSGQPNRRGMDRDELHLADPVIATAARAHWPADAEPTVTVCLACYEAILELLGALVVPPDRHGEVLADAGEADTLLLGAVLPGGDAGHTALLLFGGGPGGPELHETATFANFRVSRLTYPATRGELPAMLWTLYQDRIHELRERFGSGPDTYPADR